jgi:hypothetical protein
MLYNSVLFTPVILALSLIDFARLPIVDVLFNILLDILVELSDSCCLCLRFYCRKLLTPCQLRKKSIDLVL